MKYVPLIAAAVSRIGGKSIEFTFSSGLTSHVGYTTTSQASISLQLLWPLVNHVITHPSNSVSLQFDLLIFCSNSYYRYPESILLGPQNHCWRVPYSTLWNMFCPMYWSVNLIFIFIRINTIRKLFWPTSGSLMPVCKTWFVVNLVNVFDLDNFAVYERLTSGMGMTCSDTKNSCLYKHWHKWNFEGFLGFACSCKSKKKIRPSRWAKIINFVDTRL